MGISGFFCKPYFTDSGKIKSLQESFVIIIREKPCFLYQTATGGEVSYFLRRLIPVNRNTKSHSVIKLFQRKYPAKYQAGER